MTPTLLQATRQRFMAERGIDVQTPPREVDAAVKDYNVVLRRAMPGAYHRFDWKTPGAALADAGASGNPYWDDPVATAAKYYDTVMSTDFGAARRDLRTFTQDPRNNPLLNVNRAREPAIDQRWMRTTNPLERNQPGRANWKAAEYFRENAPNAKTPQEKAMAWDALARYRQWENQKKNGLLDSFGFKMAMLGLSAAFLPGSLMAGGLRAGFSVANTLHGVSRAAGGP